MQPAEPGYRGYSSHTDHTWRANAQLCCALLVVLDEGSLVHHVLERFAPVIECFPHLARNVKLSAIMC